MSLADLQSWLRDEGIRDDLDAITWMTVRTELDNLLPEANEVVIDWSRLLLAGSILARSAERATRDRVADCNRRSFLEQDQAICDAGAVLLGKLSNFRAVTLARQRNLLAEDLEGRLGVALRLEAQRREMERSILVESSGAWLQVNDFQQRFWNNARAELVSASAPTASGKTFLVLQWLVDQMAVGRAEIAIYLAPTRALVSKSIEHRQDPW
jgi:hypothetical protein